MSDIQHIQNNIARCKERIAQIEDGQRGVIPEGHSHQNAGRASENQLRAQRQALERFEAEYVQAMLAEQKWSPTAIIERMQAPTPANAPMPVQVLKIGDLTRGKLQTLLEQTVGAFIHRSKLQELLSK